MSKFLLGDRVVFTDEARRRFTPELSPGARIADDRTHTVRELRPRSAVVLDGDDRAWHENWLEPVSGDPQPTIDDELQGTLDNFSYVASRKEHLLEPAEFVKVRDLLVAQMSGGMFASIISAPIDDRTRAERLLLEGLVDIDAALEIINRPKGAQ